MNLNVLADMDPNTQMPMPVAIVGGGASGCLVATHLLSLLPEGTRIVLFDDTDALASGVAYSTPDPLHLLNVPAAGMSAFQHAPGHFVAWLHQNVDAGIQASDFVPRAHYGRYLKAVLDDAVAQAQGVVLDIQRARVVDIRREGAHYVLTDQSGRETRARHVVLASGLKQDPTWASDALQRDAHFIADPWTQALPAEGDLLMVGAGLTMIDLALSADRPGRKIHVLSRTGMLPHVHASPPSPPVQPPAGITRLQDLDALRGRLAWHFERVRAATGDWRPALDGLRPITARLWQQLSESDKQRFLREDARNWDVHRHRMPPITAERLDTLISSGRLLQHRGEIGSIAPSADGLTVTLTDGTRLTVSAIVNCTGAVATLHSDPLLAALAAGGLAKAGPADLGIATREDGAVLDANGAAGGLFALGALRRGDLWESTAMPEIRAQAQALATLLNHRLRNGDVPMQCDAYGNVLPTSAEAAAEYNRALSRLLRIQDGVEAALERAISIDPQFVQAHAALALLGNEWCLEGEGKAALAAALVAADSQPLDARTRSFLAAVEARLQRDAQTGAEALLQHIANFPRDAFAVGVAVPSVAFGGLTAGSHTASFIESLGKAYGDDPWYASQLGFIRQEQGRLDEAAVLVDYALSCDPSFGHAAHAKAHIHYERGEHAEGLAWLEQWIATQAATMNHRSHFSWHAALHELMLGDTEAFHRRYMRDLAPPKVSGCRILMDAGALLWRGRMTGAWEKEPCVREVIEAAPSTWFEAPPSAFAAMHVALALATASDAERLRHLLSYAESHEDALFKSTIAPLCRGLIAAVEGDWKSVSPHLETALSHIEDVGASKAQCDVVEDTIVHALAMSGQNEAAIGLLERRLARRASPLDTRRLHELKAGG